MESGRPGMEPTIFRAKNLFSNSFFLHHPWHTLSLSSGGRIGWFGKVNEWVSEWVDGRPYKPGEE